MAGTFADGYTNDKELGLLAEYGFKRNTREALRDRSINLLSDYGMLRGDNARNLELADLQTVGLPNEGFQKATAVIIILKTGRRTRRADWR